MQQILWVGLGGFLGSILRYLISRLNTSSITLGIPIGTLSANILGSLLIGILIGIFSKETLPHPNIKLFLVTGFCGGFTTFSTFSHESLVLFQNGQHLNAFIYVIGSVVSALSAVWLGYWVANLINN